MGYTTSFEGQFDLNKPLTAVHLKYLKDFAYIRHMKRDAKTTAELPDPVRLAVGLPVGNQGEYYVGSASDGNFGQGDPMDRNAQRENTSITSYNVEPSTIPGLWCKWEPTDDGLHIEWNEAEKFYDYTEWLEYLIANFLKPWGYTLNGQVEWFGEDNQDAGIIFVKNNKVKAVANKIVKAKNPFTKKKSK